MEPFDVTVAFRVMIRRPPPLADSRTPTSLRTPSRSAHRGFRSARAASRPLLVVQTRPADGQRRRHQRGCVGISPTLTEEQRQDPLFKMSHGEATKFFNSPYHFTRKVCGLLCSHDAGHVVYARLAGATDIRFHGPTMYWCSGCPGCSGNAPLVSKSSVSWTFPWNYDVTAALKADIGGITFREVLSDTPNDKPAESGTKNTSVWTKMHFYAASKSPVKRLSRI
jgi:hypothetical protein